MSIDQAMAEKIKQVLAPLPKDRLYAVLDGASIPGLLAKLSKSPRDRDCLIPGAVSPKMAAAAPYAVELKPGSDLANWLVSEGWGGHWGIYAISPGNMLAARNHFRGLFNVLGPEGQKLFFRFYDPRVFRVYLPTCNAAELKVVFRGITQYVVEAEDPAKVIVYRLAGGKLVAKESRL